MDVDKMTVDECRDWLANSIYEKLDAYVDCGSAWFRRDTGGYVMNGTHHPIPATLDAAAAAMPEGYHVTVEQQPDHRNYRWKAAAFRNFQSVFEVGDTELEARFQLAVKARTANGGGGGG